MRDFFGNITSDFDNYTLFQDEAGCEDSNFFYHGYLLVDNRFGRDILNEIFRIKGPKSKDSEITFKEIRKEDYRVPIATKWLELADKLLQEGKIRFYVLGVNKNNLKDFWDNSWNFNKNLYLKSFEIGLNSLSRWFKNDPKLVKPIQISHIFYEYGPYSDERKGKIKWLESLTGYKNAEDVYSDPKIQLSKKPELREMSEFIQLTDILLGVTKYSFIKLNPSHTGKQKCVDFFIDIIERFNSKNAYNTKSRYYKRFALGFFPTESNITKEEFLSEDFENIIKKGTFYNNRPTYRQQMVRDKNLTLF